MKTSRKIKLVNIICILSLFLLCLPQDSSAQRFGHGGGGGGGMRGGGGGGGAVRGGGFNGGGRNIGAHVYRAPAPVAREVHDGGRDGRPMGGGIRNESVYHHVSGFRPYSYHPYHPYNWGPYWHPFGFFAAVLDANAIFFTMAGAQYYYDDGVYYLPSGNGYSAVAPPIGAVVSYLPAGYETVQVGNDIFYYYAGVFYVGQGGSFRVVPSPVGAVVTEIPDGATDQSINGVDYLLYNNTYFQPVSQNGVDAYEVVQVN